MLFENYLVVAINHAVYDGRTIDDKGRLMLEQILEFFKLLFGLYDSLPEAKKQALKDFIVESFDAILRAFFRAQAEGQAA